MTWLFQWCNVVVVGCGEIEEILTSGGPPRSITTNLLESQRFSLNVSTTYHQRNHQRKIIPRTSTSTESVRAKKLNGTGLGDG